MLLNEFLKERKAFLEEQRKVQEQQETIAQLQSTVAQQQKSFEFKIAEQHKQIEALRSGLQKVSAQIEVRTSAQEVAEKNP